MRTGIELIAAERNRQIEEEGWTEEHDDTHDDGELAMAAACYAAPEKVFIEIYVDPKHLGKKYQRKKHYTDPFPWNKKYDKRDKHDRIKQLSIAGALMAAELDRLLRLEDNNPSEINND